MKEVVSTHCLNGVTDGDFLRSRARYMYVTVKSLDSHFLIRALFNRVPQLTDARIIRASQRLMAPHRSFSKQPRCAYFSCMWIITDQKASSVFVGWAGEKVHTL